jgi:hypothetical protein
VARTEPMPVSRRSIANFLLFSFLVRKIFTKFAIDD